MKKHLILCVVLITVIVLLSACTAAAQSAASQSPEPDATNTVTPQTETVIPSPTADVRPRLMTTDNGDILRPEVEIDSANFQKVKLLGQLGSGTPVVIQFSPDDTLLAVGTSVGQVKIYNAQSLELMQSIETNLLLQFPLYFINSSSICDPCGRLALSPDNKLLGIFSVKGEIRIWDLERKQTLASSSIQFFMERAQKRLAGENIRSQGFSHIQFSDDGKYLGLFSEKDIWPTDFYREPYFVISTSGDYWCGEFVCSDSSSHLMGNDLSQFGDVFTFAPENTSGPRVPLPKDVDGKTHYRGKSSLNSQYLSTKRDRAVAYDLYGVANNFPRFGNSENIYAGTLWDTADQKIINTFSFPYIDIYSFSHDLGTIAYISPAGVAVLDLVSGMDRGEISLATCLGNMSFSPDGKILASFLRNTIYFCDPLSGKVINIIRVPTGFISSIDFSPDSKILASTGQTWGNYLSTSTKNYDPFVYIWDVETGKLVSTLEHQGDTMIVKFSPDGKYIATGAGVENACAGVTSPKDERFILWSWDGQNAVKLKEQEFETGIANLAFSFDGKQILLATNRAYACSRKQPLIYTYDISNDVFSKSYFELVRGDAPTMLQYSPNAKQFVEGAFWEAATVSISGGSVNPQFSTINYIPIADKEFFGIYAKYSVVTVSPNWTILAFPISNAIKISDITYSKQSQKPGKFIYSQLVFSPDGSVIYGGANVFGVISIWGIPAEN